MMRQIFLIFFLLLSHLGSMADDDIDKDTLSTIYLNNSVIISAQRYETNEFERSESIANLKREQLSKLSPMSMPLALSYVPGDWMQRTNHGGGSPFCQGIDWISDTFAD